jgi:hypothetical protein
VADGPAAALDRRGEGQARLGRQGKHVGRPRKLTPYLLEHARTMLREAKETRAGWRKRGYFCRK